MKKAELVEELGNFIRHNGGIMKGETIFASVLMTYVSRLEIPSDVEYTFTTVEQKIPQMVIGAIHLFENSDEPWVVKARSQYVDEVGRPFEDPTRIDCSLEAILNVAIIKRIVDKVVSDFTGTQVETLLNAERELVRLHFYKFLNQVYSLGGLKEIVASNTARGMSGEFGSTTLRCFSTAGRLMFTFARTNGPREDSVSFVTDDSDPNGFGGGLQSCYAPARVAIEMLTEVISNWQENSIQFAENSSVTIV